MLNLFILVLAACLEVGGDACIRVGLRSGKAWGLIVGAIVLTIYGITVNLPAWSFGRLMGVYIALFFVISQIVAIFFMHEKLPLPTMVGGALIIAGGLVMTLWRTT